MMKKIIGVVVIVIVIVLWNPFTLLPKSGPVWADDAYLIARTNDGFSLIYPADYYRYVFFPFRKLTKNDRIWKNAVDCKGNGNKLLLVYITEETEHDLVLRIIDPEKIKKLYLRNQFLRISNAMHIHGCGFHHTITGLRQEGFCIGLSRLQKKWAWKKSRIYSHSLQ